MVNPILVALDVPSLEHALALVDVVGDAAGGVKIGMELFDAEGPRAVEALAERGLFLDLKLHDIPTTVRRTVAALAPLGPAMLNVHALGGRAMLEAANETKGKTKILAVTILTSLGDGDLKEIGLPPAAEAVPMLAALAREAGCDGVVCAPADVAAVRAVAPAPFLIVTPGIRPAGSPADDQVRTMTPRQALDAGADYLVVGRPITRAPDPRAAAESILRELA
ncbi:MAG TPA: orotidine-5'-phosphate decarboxylase [Actinomycetota bacterium]